MNDAKTTPRISALISPRHSNMIYSYLCPTRHTCHISYLNLVYIYKMWIELSLTFDTCTLHAIFGCCSLKTGHLLPGSMLVYCLCIWGAIENHTILIYHSHILKIMLWNSRLGNWLQIDKIKNLLQFYLTLSSDFYWQYDSSCDNNKDAWNSLLLSTTTSNIKPAFDQQLFWWDAIRKKGPVPIVALVLIHRPWHCPSIEPILGQCLLCVRSVSSKHRTLS